MRRPHPPRSAIERDIVEAEAAVAEFADRHPSITVTVLRFANGVGPDLRTSHTHLFSLPVVPAVLGFDPRYQFIHEEDMAGCLEHAVRHDLPGIYNCASDGVLALSEVAGLLGKPLAPLLTPVGTRLAAASLRRFGIRIPNDLIEQLKFGRGLDNRLFKASGYRYRYTTREAVIKLREHQRIKGLLAGSSEGYRYEREVEEFLRWSPSVRRPAGMPRAALANVAPGGAARAALAAPSYDDLTAEELVALLPSLDAADLPRLREHEAANAAREKVLRAIDRLL
jgi:UDP-glucose 4-epimerase